ncbi:uncharacterized protein TNCV_342961 [Trichonephila clavipes]|nr:uncharacterized protein TNCV_342961 [Trichonephila clavipes]
MKAGSALVPVMAVCWLEGDQGNACNQTVCVLDPLDLHQESWFGGQSPMTAGALSRRSFPMYNAHPPTPVIIQRALHSVDLLPWSARSPDLSPIETYGVSFDENSNIILDQH